MLRQPEIITKLCDEISRKYIRYFDRSIRRDTDFKGIKMAGHFDEPGINPS